jgi:O-antigen/teichoic acid export membrane protein
LSSSTGLAAFGGFVYWLAIARIAPAHVVGVAAALYSSVQFVNYVTGLGLPIAVARYGGSPKERPSVLFNWSVVLTVVSSFVGTALFLAIVPDQLHAMAALGVVGAVLVFGLIVAGISVYTVLDVRLISQQRRSWVVGKAGAVAGSRLPLLLVPALTHSALAIFLVAAGAPAATGLVAWVLADLRSAHFTFPLRPLPADARAALQYAVVNGAAQLAVQAPFYVVPLIVLITVSSRENAFFYVAWTITTVVFLVLQGVGQALLVEGHRTGHLAAQTRTALRMGLALGVVLFAVCLVASRLVPTLYGPSYSESANLMVILSSAVLPWSVFTVVLAATRVHHSQRQNVVLSVLFAVSILVPAAFWIIHFGISGAAWAWLGGNVISGLAALLVLRQLRGQPEADTPAGVTASEADMDLLDNPEFL